MGRLILFGRIKSANIQASDLDHDLKFPPSPPNRHINIGVIKENHLRIGHCTIV